MARDLFSRYKLRNLMFFIFVIGGIVCSISGFVVDIIFNGFLWTSLLFAACLVVFAFGLALNRFISKRDGFLLIMFMALDFVLTPLLFYVYELTIIPLIIMVYVGTVIFLNKKAFRIILPIAFALDIVSASFVIAYPQKLVTLGDNHFIPAIMMFIMVALTLSFLSIAMRGQYHRELARNEELQESLASYSKRDTLTRAFNKDFASEYLESMIRDGRKFTIAAYKIASFDHLKSKFGNQFCDVGVVSLSEIILREAASISLVARYSDSTFIIIFNELDTEEVKNALFNINDSLNNGLTKTLEIIRAVENADGENAGLVLEKISGKINGFGK